MIAKETQSSRNAAEERKSAPRRGVKSEEKTPARKRRAAAAAYRAQREGRQADPFGPARGTLLFRQSLLPMVEHVHHIDQTSLRVGVIWLLILPILLLVIRRLTGSSKVAFLIIWIVGMFIISAALILVAYADHELKRFLEDVKQYVPAATDTELDELLQKLESDGALNLDGLGSTREILRGALERRRERRESGLPESEEETLRRLRIEAWLQRLEQRRGKEESDAEYSQDHTD